MNSTKLPSAAGESRQLPEPNLSKIGLECDLCGMGVKGQAYLAQHRGKKKCVEKQRKTKEMSMAQSHMSQLRLSVSESEGNPSKVISHLAIVLYFTSNSLQFKDMGPLSLQQIFWESWGFSLTQCE